MNKANSPIHLVFTRIGVSTSGRTQINELLTPGVGSTCHDEFYAEITCFQGKGFIAEVTLPANDGLRYSVRRSGGATTGAHAIKPRHLFANFDNAAQAVGRFLAEKLAREVVLANGLELYCPSDPEFLKRAYPYVLDDVEYKRARYEPETETIRSVPENYCLIYWDEAGRPRYDMDAVTQDQPGVPASCQWRNICPVSHEAYLQPVNQREGLKQARTWLAWLVSQNRKYGVGR